MYNLFKRQTAQYFHTTEYFYTRNISIHRNISTHRNIFLHRNISIHLYHGCLLDIEIQFFKKRSDWAKQKGKTHIYHTLQ